jgi:hypothetical protein
LNPVELGIFNSSFKLLLKLHVADELPMAGFEGQASHRMELAQPKLAFECETIRPRIVAQYKFTCDYHKAGNSLLLKNWRLTLYGRFLF